MAQAIAAIKLKPTWERIEIIELGPRDYSLRLHYKEISPKRPVMKLDAVVADTKQIARAVLGQLLKEGRNPANEYIDITVYALQFAGTGETGKALVKAFGHAYYDKGSDQIEFALFKR